MKIGKYVAVRPYNESGTFALDRLAVAKAAALPAVVRVAEQILERLRSILAPVVLLRGFDDHDTRRHGLENFRECVVQLMNDIFTGFRGSGRNGRRFLGEQSCRDANRKNEKETHRFRL